MGGVFRRFGISRTLLDFYFCIYSPILQLPAAPQVQDRSVSKQKVRILNCRSRYAVHFKVAVPLPKHFCLCLLGFDCGAEVERLNGRQEFAIAV